MVTAFTLQQGGLNISDPARKFYSPVLIHCEADGSFDITWKDGGTDTIVLTVGEDRYLDFPEASVNVASGTFSFSSIIGG
jgi:hypothetical protein